MGYLKQLCLFSLVTLVCLIVGCADKESDNKLSSDVTASNQSLDANIYERKYSPTFGLDSAKVTIVEFFDPACEACRAFYPIVKEIMSRHPDDVRLVLRYATLHKDSETVVRLLEAARLQNTFEPVLEALLQYQEQWASHRNPNVDRAWEIAETAGLNIASAKAVMNTEEINKIIIQEAEDLRKLKVRQTPTFFVNGKSLPSFGAQQLYDLVVSELKQ
jgi:protein-disulfide isomerase